MTVRDNPARPNPIGEDLLASVSAHVRGRPIESTPGTFAVACACGTWYEDGLPSKRAAHRAMTRHLEENGSLAFELDNPTGRGRIAARARDRALEVLIARHAAELADLEERERVALGLTPTYREESPA